MAISDFESEFKQFIVEYVLPLLGISANPSELKSCREEGSSQTSYIAQQGEHLIFSNQTTRFFSLELNGTVSDDSLQLANRVLQDFPRMSIYSYKTNKRRLPSSFPSEILQSTMYSKIVQNGICCWVNGDKNAQKLHELFEILEMWAVKTYEGKKVTMGFVISKEEHPDSAEIKMCNRDFLEFLKDDCSATLTDCIHSVFELDSSCNLIGYRTLDDNGTMPAHTLCDQSPIRFSHIIDKYTENKCGIFLLNNGDIVLSKSGKICLVRRNLRWLNLSFDAFQNSLQKFVNAAGHTEEESLPDLIPSVFASILDVSFSHTGGIIAIVNDNWEDLANKGNKDGILADVDNLFERLKLPDSEVPLKRKMIDALVSKTPFPKISRKLRCELLGMDGACILRRDGRVQAFSAIIRNESGTPGGARSAAAKKLSQYGMAVKVSADGYIEVYINGSVVYSVK